MTIERKLLGTSPSGGATDVAEVFSTGLHIGNATNTAITNGIDLAGEGGMVWVKSRTLTENHAIFDTERQGANWYLSSDTTAAENQDTGNPMMVSFNSDGYTLGVNNFTNGYDPYVAWTFRQKSGFFDCVTWSGDNSTNRQISHSLSGPVGMIILKCTSHATNWTVFHTSLGGTKRLVLNRGDISVQTSQEYWNNTNPTSTNFTVGGSGDNNATGRTYVAYLFADNSSEDADDQMIKCGSYTGNGYATHIDINLGWEPQFVLLKNATASGGDLNWQILDTMRGYGVRQSNEYAGTTRLRANTSDAEQNPNSYYGGISSTGFSAYEDNVSYSGDTYIYMAIRAPMMVQPSAGSATDVFAPVNYTGDDQMPDNITGFGFSPNMLIFSRRDATFNHRIFDRLRGFSNGDLITDDTAAENSTGDQILQGPTIMDGFRIAPSGTNYLNTTGVLYHSLGWKRAKGYMDVVCYSGNGTAGRTVPHSLSVIPEMIWFKSRNNAYNWYVYHKDTGIDKRLVLDGNDGTETGYGTLVFNNTQPSSSVITLGSWGVINGSGNNNIAYLFATLAGISKVGSYTGNGSNQTIACGFSAGSRYILIKRTDVTGDWFFWDSARGIVAGNDPHLSLNTTAAQVTTDDSVDPANAGFIVNQVSATNINVSSATYIFYAIA